MRVVATVWALVVTVALAGMFLELRRLEARLAGLPPIPSTTSAPAAIPAGGKSLEQVAWERERELESCHWAGVFNGPDAEAKCRAKLKSSPMSQPARR